VQCRVFVDKVMKNFLIKYGEFLELAGELLVALERLCRRENLLRFCLFGYSSDLRLLKIPLFQSECGNNEYKFIETVK